MANDRNSHWIEIIDPEERGVFPLDRFHVPRRLKKLIKQQPFSIRVNTAFTQTISACAEINESRDNTWISDGIINLYSDLHRQGYAHSIECWEDNILIGGLYGVSLEGMFFGESMFSRKPNASKIALVHLAAGLKNLKYTILDAQFHNPHLEQFGLETMSRAQFHACLEYAKQHASQFSADSIPKSGVDALQAITQTS